MDSFERLGVWWLPDKPNDERVGMLRWSPRDGVRLELVDTFEDLDEVAIIGRQLNLNKMPRYPVLLGTLKDHVEQGLSREVTLLDCQGLGYSGGPPVKGEEVRATAALLGHHFTTPEPRFDTLKICVEHLWYWAGVSGFDRKNSGFNDQRTKWNLLWKRPDCPSAQGLNQEQITLGLRYMTRGTASPSPGFEETPEIMVKLSDPLAIDELNRRFIRPMQNLLTLGVDYPVEVTSIRLSNPEILATSADGTVYGRDYVRLLRRRGPHTVASMHRQPSVGDMLFMLNDYDPGWSELIPRWLQLQDKLEYAGDVFFGSRYAPASYTETRFLSLAQSLEGYHRRCFSNEKIPEKDHRRRLREVMKEVPKEHRSWVNEKLWRTNEPDFGDRVQELVKSTGSLLQPLLGNTHRFVRAVVQSRNHYTHQKQESDEAVARGLGLYWLTDKVSWLLRVWLLLDLGFAPDCCGKLLHRNNAYQWAVAQTP